MAAWLDGWLAERELDVQETTIANYRDVIGCYVTPYRQPSALHGRQTRDPAPGCQQGVDEPLPCKMRYSADAMRVNEYTISQRLQVSCGSRAGP